MSTKKYQVTAPYYRNQTGEYFPKDSIVEIPADEEPSMHWLDAETGKPVPKKVRLDVGPSALTEEEKAFILELRKDKAAAEEKSKAVTTKGKATGTLFGKSEDKGRASDKEAL